MRGFKPGTRVRQTYKLAPMVTMRPLIKQRTKVPTITRSKHRYQKYILNPKGTEEKSFTSQSGKAMEINISSITA